MAAWEKIEQECFEYIKDNYSSEKVSFEHKGARDSSAPDIVATLSNGTTFNIEVKSATAQSGQFVVFDKNGQFAFSKENVSSEALAAPFIEYMNNNHDALQNPGGRGIKLDIPTETMFKWVIGYYNTKNVKFFATKYRGKIVIFPTERLQNYFEISRKYRVKRSGSGNIPKKCVSEVSSLFDGEHYYDGKYFVLKNLFLQLHQKTQGKDRVYYVSKKHAEDGYVITYLSKTQNPNVIFSLKAKKAQSIEDLKAFEEALKV